MLASFDYFTFLRIQQHKHNTSFHLRACLRTQAWPLLVAVQARNEAVVELLLAVGASTAAGSNGTLPLVEAFRPTTHYSIALALISAGAALNGVDQAGNTLLHNAADSDDEQAVRMLLEVSYQSQVCHDMRCVFSAGSSPPQTELDLFEPLCGV